MVTDLCSIGTLFAFVLVCAGVLVLQNKTDIPREIQDALCEFKICNPIHAGHRFVLCVQL
jgi:hypothetical protein